jgi:hypothetical protein
MKKLLFVLMCLIPILCLGQDRVNKELPKLSEPLSVLAQAKGWYYSSDGQWIGHNNSIANQHEFSKYEFRDLIYRGDTLLILIKYKIEGYWKYPSIMEGYTSYTDATCYLLNKKDYLDKISKYDSTAVIEFTSLKRIAGPYIVSVKDDVEKRSLYYFENTEDKFDVDFYYSKTDLPTYKITFQFKNYDSQNISRFFIIEEECSKNKDNCNLRGIEISTKKDTFKELKTDKIYELYYYETSANLFNNFLQLKKEIKPKQQNSSKKKKR